MPTDYFRNTDKHFLHLLRENPLESLFVIYSPQFNDEPVLCQRNNDAGSAIGKVGNSFDAEIESWRCVNVKRTSGGGGAKFPEERRSDGV